MVVTAVMIKLLLQRLLDLKDQYNAYLEESFQKDPLFKQAISSVSGHLCVL